MKVVQIVTCSVVLLLTSMMTQAQTPCEFQKLVPSGSDSTYGKGFIIGKDRSGNSSEHFGKSVAIDGNLMVIGAFGTDDGSDDDVGVAYVYRFDGSEWDQEAILEASDGEEDDYFGFSVDISGNVIIVGAYLADMLVGDPPNQELIQGTGAAYIYRYSGSSWVEEQILHPDEEPEPLWQQFGWSVGISGDCAVISAHEYDTGNETVGAAYIYRYSESRSGWSKETILIEDDDENSATFGSSVAIDGDTVVVGSHDADEGPQLYDRGAAYVFRYSGSSWSQEAKLTAPANDSEEDDYFGWSVSIDGDVVVIGAWGDDTESMLDHGSAYVFSYNQSSWSRDDKLTASDPGGGDAFGNSVNIDGDNIIVGAEADNTASTNSGSAYLFRYVNSSWDQEAKMTASDGGQNDFYGSSVALSGDTAVIGASGDRNGDGSAYVNNVSTEDCNENGVSDTCDINAGTSYDCDEDGIPLECEECPADITGDGTVDVNDIFALLGLYGDCDDPCPPYCCGDLTEDCTVDINDTFYILGEWGDCE